MARQSANPTGVAKIDRLAVVTGLRKAVAIDEAVDLLLAQLDRIPDVDRPRDALSWDENGLPQ